MKPADAVGQILAAGLVLFLTCFGTAGCATGVTREDLLQLMQEGAAPLIIDVRTQGEYDRDHVPGAVHIPFYMIGSKLHARKFSKNDPLVLYCEHGPRADMASLSLFLEGYTEVYSLKGGMKGWRKNAYPIEIISRVEDAPVANSY
jgi:rhodanese-related sulfurtransferase